VGAALAAWCLAFSAALLWRGLTLDIDLPAVGAYVGSAFFLVIACLFAYWTYGCMTLRYHLDRNGLTIYWGDIRQLVPMDRIERLVPGRERAAPKVSGVSWVGHHVGHGKVEGLGDVLFYATHRTHDQLLYVVTAEQTYGISVPDEVRFAEDLQGHQKMGPVASLPQVTEREGLAAQPFWHDQIAQVLALGSFAAFIVMLGYVFQNYPGLPETIPFAFPNLSGVTRVDDKSELLAIPLTGVGFLSINLVLGYVLHAWERAVGYLMLLAGIGAQIILLCAAIVTLNQ
jgi:hypothetical protein